MGVKGGVDLEQGGYTPSLRFRYCATLGCTTESLRDYCCLKTAVRKTEATLRGMHDAKRDAWQPGCPRDARAAL